jgi:hypothetical protein
VLILRKKMRSGIGKSFAGFLMAALCVLPMLCAGCDKEGGEAQGQVEFGVEKEYSKGEFSVVMRLSGESVGVSDLLIMEIESVSGQRFDVEMPSLADALSELEIRDWRQFDDRLGENDSIVRVRRYRLEPLAPGVGAVGELTFEFEQDGDIKETIITEAVEIEVTSLLDELGTELVIEDIEDVVSVRANMTVWWVGGGCVALVVAGFVLWRLLRPKREAEIARIFRPAHAIAYDILRRLKEDKLVEAGRIKEFYERLSDCLRHYIEHRFSLRAPERTTEEFLAELKDEEALSSEYRNDLKMFLEHCDLVKFARFDPSAEQIEETLRMVQEFVDKTRADECKVDVTDVEALAG